MTEPRGPWLPDDAPLPMPMGNPEPSAPVHVVHDIPKRYYSLLKLSLGLATTAMGTVVTIAIHCLGG